MFSDDIIISLDNITKTYRMFGHPADRLKQAVSFGLLKNHRDFVALEDVSLSIRRGETVAIIGRNGSGKSTLLQIICGILKPTSGTVAARGRISALLELGAGFNPEFTGRENVFFQGALMGFRYDEIEERFDRIVEFADIGEFIDEPVRTYSSGMFVRLAFAVQACTEPSVLVVDEALAVGDFMFQQKCAKYIKESLEGVTKILVSHDLSTVSHLADRVIVLADGKVAFDGSTQAGLSVYLKLARRSVGSPHSTSEGSTAPYLEHPQMGGDRWIKVRPSITSGVGLATIDAARWKIAGREACNDIREGDELTLDFILRVDQTLESPVIGYQIQDRFGSVIFGENSISSGLSLATVMPGLHIVSLCFSWPQVAPGSYGVTVGVGDGSESTNHVIHCWAHNFMTVGSVQEAPVHGIFNNKISSIFIESS